MLVRPGHRIGLDGRRSASVRPKLLVRPRGIKCNGPCSRPEGWRLPLDLAVPGAHWGSAPSPSQHHCGTLFSVCRTRPGPLSRTTTSYWTKQTNTVGRRRFYRSLRLRRPWSSDDGPSVNSSASAKANRPLLGRAGLTESDCSGGVATTLGFCERSDARSAGYARRSLAVGSVVARRPEPRRRSPQRAMVDRRAKATSPHAGQSFREERSKSVGPCRGAHDLGRCGCA